MSSKPDHGQRQIKHSQSSENIHVDIIKEMHYNLLFVMFIAIY